MTKIENFRLMEGRFADFFSSFRSLFTSLTRSVALNALLYVKGLMVCSRRNCQVMEEELLGKDTGRFHHLITEAKWCAFKVMDKTTTDVYQNLQHLKLAGDICLIIGESGNPKKGIHSAGVKRQYCGQLGKVDNCQVDVYDHSNKVRLPFRYAVVFLGQKPNVRVFDFQKGSENKDVGNILPYLDRFVIRAKTLTDEWYTKAVQQRPGQPSGNPGKKWWQFWK